MVAEPSISSVNVWLSCSLAKISMVAERGAVYEVHRKCCSLAKISMVAEPQNI